VIFLEAADVPLILHQGFLDPLEDPQQVGVTLAFVLRHGAQLRPARGDPLLYLRRVKYCFKYRSHGDFLLAI
jgi:hypothetical protein